MSQSPNKRVGGFLSRNWKWIALGIAILAAIVYLTDKFGS